MVIETIGQLFLLYVMLVHCPIRLKLVYGRYESDKTNMKYKRNLIFTCILTIITEIAAFALYFNWVA